MHRYAARAGVLNLASIQISARSKNTISDPASGNPITTRTPNIQAK